MAPLAPPAVPQKATRWHHHCFQFHPSAPPSFGPSCYSTSQDSIFHFNIHSLSLYYTYQALFTLEQSKVPAFEELLSYPEKWNKHVIDITC